MLLIPKTRFSRIHMVGIGGSGMSGIAEILHRLGFEVQGSDLSPKDTTRRLESLGIRVFYGHKYENVKGAHIVVFSSAIPPDNPELQAARDMGIPLVQRAEMLAELMRVKFSIGVAGAHGKSTTTSMIGHVLKVLGTNPTVIVGGILREVSSGGLYGSGDYLVAEADESDRSFLKLLPSIAVITNIDREHIDTYGSMANLKLAFIDFANRVPFYGAVLACGDDENTRHILPFVERRLFTYGLDEGNFFRAENVQLEGLKSLYDLRVGRRSVGRVKLNVPGLFNVRNSLAALGVAWELGLNVKEAAESLEDFRGVGRRFEIKGEIGDVKVIDDYGHHPTEIEAVLDVALRLGRVVVVFQPHRYTRTRDLYKQFAEVLSKAHFVILLPVYPAGEKTIPGVGSHLIYDHLKRLGYENVVMVENKEEAARIALQKTKAGDIVLLQGAGDVYKVWNYMRRTKATNMS
ncbi:MAG: UDP-N-acetylmuramate--L-alanine ligase [Thermotogae bacterium]|nr:UDP-N-acetylmuramate--L-alanine ligase [Thermotogota bacterium]